MFYIIYFLFTLRKRVPIQSHTNFRTWREEHRLRVFENTVLRIFGPKREEDGSWRKLHNDELHGLYSPPNVVIKSKKMKWAGHVARTEEG
jgi:hypothetical protein